MYPDTKESLSPRVKASVAASGITAQIRPSSGLYTVSAVPMMKVPPTQVAEATWRTNSHRELRRRDVKQGKQRDEEARTRS